MEGKLFKCMVLFVATISVVYCQENPPPQCQNPSPISSFNASNLEGIWHQYSVASNAASDVIQQFKCLAMSLSYLQANVGQVVFTPENVTVGMVPVVGVFTPSAAGDNVFNITFINQATPLGNGVFGILDTDYNNYAIIYQCIPVGSSVIVFTREKIQNINSQLQTQIDEKLNNLKSFIQSTPIGSIAQEKCGSISS